MGDPPGVLSLLYPSLAHQLLLFFSTLKPPRIRAPFSTLSITQFKYHPVSVPNPRDTFRSSLPGHFFLLSLHWYFLLVGIPLFLSLSDDYWAYERPKTPVFLPHVFPWPICCCSSIVPIYLQLCSPAPSPGVPMEHQSIRMLFEIGVTCWKSSLDVLAIAPTQHAPGPLIMDS